MCHNVGIPCLTISTIRAKKQTIWTKKNAKRIAAAVLVCGKQMCTNDCITRATITLIDKKLIVALLSWLA